MSIAENMVLRTVYLPRSLDSRLRDFAFRLGVSKGEFMRSLVQEALDARYAAGERSFMDEADQTIDVSAPSRVESGGVALRLKAQANAGAPKARAEKVGADVRAKSSKVAA